MSADPGNRRILPQNPQMQQTYSFSNFAPRENQKNYVFVDEHNRHKRLKVMRACEGCRRRKIKCDAATTNSWPCSACIRLKLHCVPPTINYDRDFPGSAADGYKATAADYDQTVGAEYSQIPLQQQMGGQPKLYEHQIPYGDGLHAYQQPQYAPPTNSQHQLQYGSIPTSSGVLDGTTYSHSFSGPSPLSQQALHDSQLPQASHHSSESPKTYHSDQYGEHNLADLLGDLKMDETGTAPYLKKPNMTESLEEPVYDEIDDYKSALPPLTHGPDLKIRIPPELMPDDETALHYFNLYFTNVHPYVPVLSKAHFYHQWHTNRDSLSPLIIEAIFAIAGRLADEPAQGQQWLALVSKHADSFMDVPRLSTLQAMLIVLKARESIPKRGYYYRSWMTVVQCVAMAKDLGLHDHYRDHKAGRPCGSNPVDCAIKTRIWQTIFVVEVMIGSSQRRMGTEGVDIESVDMSIPPNLPSHDEADNQVFRNFAYFLRVPINVRKMGIAFTSVRDRKDWGLDPEFVALNNLFESWVDTLPPDLQIKFPSDSSPPWLPSHFLGNMHSYHYLLIVMLHRPQMMSLDPSQPDGAWKQQMMICYDAAKKLCRIQEAILASFGLPGLLCMQRGINYTIYAILTCTVLHLVALTSPDPDLNSDARDFFTRHMRILEKCSSSWPMPDMQQQIDSLREAFSADTRKPFVLKPSFPYGSPAAPASTSPPGALQYRQPDMVRAGPSMDNPAMEQVQPHMAYGNPITPPISAGSVDHKSEAPPMQSMVMMAPQRTQPQMVGGVVPMVDTSSWNPSRIFDQWNTTFGSPTSTHQTAALRHQMTGSQDSALSEMPTGAVVDMPVSQQGQQYLPAPMPSTISPSMWRESVASVYEGGLKRQWDYSDNQIQNQMVKRLR